MGRSRDYLPFPRGTTATAGDTLIVNQLGSMSAIDALANQTNPAATTDTKTAGVGGPGQVPTTALPYQGYRADLAGFIGDCTDDYVFGLKAPMLVRAVQYIPTSGQAFLVLDGHALAVSTTHGWFGSVVTGVQTGTAGTLPTVLPDPAYFTGKSSATYVKPYDWFFVVEEGWALGTVVAAASVAPYTPLMSDALGNMLAATAAKFVVGMSDGNNGNTVIGVTSARYGWGQYLVPTTNTPALGTVNTTTGAVTAAANPATFSNPFAPFPSGATVNAWSSAGVAGQYMPSGAQYNASGYVAVYCQPLSCALQRP